MTPFEQAAAAQPPASDPVLHYYAAYDAQGKITRMSMEPLQEPHLEITRDQYLTLNPNTWRVKSGELKPLDPTPRRVLQLRTSVTGEFATLPGNMMFAATEGDRYTAKRYEEDN